MTSLATNLSTNKNSVFLKTPDILYVDDHPFVPFPAHETIDELMLSLQHTALVANGRMGPNAYKEEPSKLKVNPLKLKDKVEIYYWKKSDTFNPSAIESHVLLLGAQHISSCDFVYFTLAQDIAPLDNGLIRGYKPLENPKIYVMSYKKFLDNLFSLRSICPHAQWLYSIPVHSIIDGNETQEKCKQVGREIFNHYKNIFLKLEKVEKEASEDAGTALKRICKAAAVFTANDFQRKEYISWVWGFNKIGDKYWERLKPIKPNSSSLPK